MFTLDYDLFIPGIAFGKERFVVVRAVASPAGPYTGLLRCERDGPFRIYTSNPAYPDLVRTFHRVSAHEPAEVRILDQGDRISVTAAPRAGGDGIQIDVATGATLGTRALNLALALTLPPVRESSLFVRAVGPLASFALGSGPGRAAHGRTEIGTRVYFAARSVRLVTGGFATIGGADCGWMRAMRDDAPDWGDIKTPLQPVVVAGKFNVEAPVPACAAAVQ